MGPNGSIDAGLNMPFQLALLRPNIPNMKAELSVTCRHCGRRTPSALQMEPRTFADVRIGSNLERCHLCSRVDGYGRDDYYSLTRAPTEPPYDERAASAWRNRRDDTAGVSRKEK